MEDAIPHPASITAALLAALLAVSALPAPLDAAEDDALRKGVEAYDRQAYQEALPHLIEAAISEEPEAQYRIGEIYRQGLGIEPSVNNALKWHRRAAEQGHAPAMMAMAELHASGPPPILDQEAAARWYRRAAEAGNAKAQFELGLAFAAGRGVEENQERAVAWLQRAADQDYRPAFGHLGYHYKTGTGVRQDQEKALQLYFRGAEMGDAQTMFNLALMFRRGRLTDLEKALTWFTLARISGHGLAGYDMDATKREMTPEAIARATERAIACHREGLEACR